MLRLASAEELEGLLLQLPGLVGLQERRAFEFPERTRSWLASVEDALASNRLYQAGVVATLRSGMASAELGQLLPGLEFRGRVTRSRVMAAAASRALQAAAEVASAVVAENRPRFAEGERVAQQIVAAARSRAVLPSLESGMSNTEFLKAVRRSLAASPDLENAAVHLEGLVGPSDAFVLLDRALGSVGVPGG